MNLLLQIAVLMLKMTTWVTGHVVSAHETNLTTTSRTSVISYIDFCHLSLDKMRFMKKIWNEVSIRSLKYFLSFKSLQERPLVSGLTVDKKSYPCLNSIPNFIFLLYRGPLALPRKHRLEVGLDLFPKKVILTCNTYFRNDSIKSWTDSFLVFYYIITTSKDKQVTFIGFRFTRL
jgi:hypothetical protein